MKYMSEKTNKVYDSIKELEKAEAIFDKEEAAKKAKSEAKKADASKVEEAFKKLNAGKKAYNEKVTEAKKVYFEEVAKAKEKANKVIDAEAKELDKLELAYNEAFKEFTKAHPEGYHLTLKDGDIVKTISKSYDDSFLDSFFKSFFDRY